jgi:MFS family permease
MVSIIDEFGLNHAQAGFLMTMAVVPGIILAIPAGMLVDRYGVKATGSSASVLIALGCWITAAASSFGMALLGRLVLGVGGVFIVTAMPAIIPQWFPPDDLGKAMGLYGINMPVASITAFSVASMLASSHGWRYLFYIATIIAVSNTILLLLLLKEGPMRDERKGESNLRQTISNVEIWKVGLIWLLFNAAVISFTTWAPKLFQDFKALTPIRSAFLASILMWASMPFAPVFGWASDRIGRRRPLMVIGSILMAGALTLVAQTSGPVMIASLIALGVSVATVPPMVMALPPVILGPQSAGTGFGITTVCMNAGIALAPPLIGFLIDATGAPTLSFTGMAIFSISAAAIAYTLKTN